MTIILTLREISDRLGSKEWGMFCNMKGLHYYCMNEGTASPDEEFELTLEDCKQIGIPVSIAGI